MGIAQKDNKDEKVFIRMTFKVTGDTVEMIDHKVVEDVKDLEEIEEENILDRITMDTVTITLCKG